MRIGRCLQLLLIGTLIISNVQIASGNGRSTPQPSGASPLMARCSLSDIKQLEIFRVKLRDDDGMKETLKVTIDGVTEWLLLSEISQLIFPTTDVNTDGFMNASIYRTDSAEKESSMVQVETGDTRIRLTGFKSNGSAVSVDLSSCQAVRFCLVH